MKKFDTSISDSQASVVEPLAPESFPFEDYISYENNLSKRCRDFWYSKGGVLIYRRMRVAEVFSFGCRDMKKSLEWQLGALAKSMAFKADIPNFLEPWYGIGTTASAFDIDYIWNKGQSPAIQPKFKSIIEALNYPVKKVSDTEIGKHTLNMTEYFLDKTGGRLPMSFCDIQSPFNVAPNVVDSTAFFTDMYLNPDKINSFLYLLADLIIDFTLEQQKIIGDALVYPGHSFASSRKFGGFGMSEDNIIMIEPNLYTELLAPSFEHIGDVFGGSVLHSCGDYSNKLYAVKRIRNLKMIDAAFSAETDPDPNPPEAFRDAFANSGIVVNARIVGDLRTIKEKVNKLWAPGMKLVVVTFCQTPEEQEKAYELVHEICQ